MLNTLREKLEERGLQIIDISIEHVVVRFQQQEASISLENLYRILMHTDDKAQRHAHMDHFALQVSQHFEDVSAPIRIFPLLAPDKPDPRLHAPWSAPLLPNHLKLLLAEEQGNRLRLMSPMDVVRSGRSMVELKQEAMQNLYQMSHDLEPSVDILGQHRFEIGDGFDASRFLMIVHWFPTEDLWISIPSRDSLWIRSSQPDNVANIALQEAYTELPYPLLSNWIQLPSHTDSPEKP